MTRLGRSWQFARRVPPAQVLRRLSLQLRRWFEARLRPSLGADAVPAAQPPLPIFPPRQGMAAVDGEAWRFRFLGREVPMAGAIDWRAPESQLWRMNLHYMEYLEELADAEFASAMRQWIAANPPYDRRAEQDGWSAYAISLRTMVWMQQLALRRARLDPALRAEAEASLAAQLTYLHRHLETDVGGNHLIKNIKALAWGSAYFAGADADRWRRTALRLLDREIDRQILPDGVHFELSPAYHCQVLADLLETRHALGANPLHGRLDAALGRAVSATAKLAHPDGGIALFGDAGLTMSYRPGACLKAARALLGVEAETPGVFALRAAGYFGARAGGDFVIVDAGQIGPAALPAHSHGDIFSFEWSLAGERVIVDQGVFEYVAGAKRQASRSALSHNTLCLAGGDQADFFGAFRAGRRARVELLRYEADEAGFLLDARHDGFACLPGKPIHRRTFAAAPDRLRIEDRIEGSPEVGARVALLLAPQIRPEIIDSNQVRLSGETATALLTASAPFAIEEAVWWPDMGVELPTKRLVIALRPGESAWIELAPASGRRGRE